MSLGEKSYSHNQHAVQSLKALVAMLSKEGKRQKIDMNEIYIILNNITKCQYLVYGSDMKAAYYNSLNIAPSNKMRTQCALEFPRHQENSQKFRIQI